MTPPENRIQATSFHQIRLFLESYGIRLPSPVTLLIWALGIGLMSGLTLNELLPLIDEYQHNNQAINVAIILIDDSFKSPEITLRIPHYQYRRPTNITGKPVIWEPEELITIARHIQNGSQDQCRSCEKLKLIGWDVWNQKYFGSEYLNHTLETFYNSLWLSYMTKIFATFDDQNILDEQFSTQNAPIFSAILNFFMWQSRIDYFFIDISTDLGSQELAQHLDTLVRQNSDKMEPLFDRLLQYICRQFDFYETESVSESQLNVRLNRSCSDLIIGTDTPVLVDQDGIWIPLPSVNTSVMKVYSFSMSNSSIWIPPQDSTIHRSTIVYPDRAILYLADTDPLSVSSIFQSPTDKTTLGHKIVVKYSVQMRARDSRQTKHNCYDGNNAPVCFIKCTKQRIIKACRCVPFIFRKGFMDKFPYPFCDYGSYVACNVSEAQARYDHCLRRCQRSCDFASYNWNIEYSSFQPREPNSTGIILQTIPVYNSFTEFSWVDKTTHEQFFAQMAGIANLYLGFSGLSLVAGIVGLIQIIQKVRERRLGSNKDTSDGTTEHTTSIQGTVQAMTAPQYEMLEQNIQAWLAKMKLEIKEELKKEHKSSETRFEYTFSKPSQI